MNDTRKSLPGDKTSRPRAGFVTGIAGLVVFGLTALVIIFMGVLSLWLTPERLSGIVSSRAEKYLNADIHTGDIRFTLWSSFPRLHIEIDSISIRSRNFDNTPRSDMKRLPDNAPFLASASRLSGGINVLRLIAGEISLRDISIEDLDLNLVALDDSLTNYDIIRLHDNMPVDIPHITANSITLLRPRPITYFSAASASSAAITLRRASILRLGHESDRYNMTLGGKITFATDGMRILDGFPFSLAGHVGLGFRPFSLDFRDYRIALGNVEGKMNLSVNLGDNVNINDFNYTITSADLMKLVQYLPSAYIPLMERINADLQVKMSGRLLKPYSYSPSSLPTFAVDFEVDRGNLSYTLADNSTYSLHDILLDATFIFDGDNPASSRFDISSLSLKGPGSSIGLSASITRLMTDPSVDTEISLAADLGTVGRHIRELTPFRLSGTLDSHASLAFSLGSISSPSIKDISLKGHADLNNYSLSSPPADLHLHGDLLKIGFGGRARTLSAFNPDDALLRFSGQGGTLAYSGHGMSARADGISLSGGFSGGLISSGTPLHVGIGATSATFASSADSLSAAISGLSASAALSDHGDDYKLSLSAAADALRLLHSADNEVRLGHTALTATVANAIQQRKIPAPYPQNSDTILLSRLPHTPALLDFDPPPGLRRFASRYDFTVSLSSAGGRVITDMYPADNRLGKLLLTADNRHINLRNLDFNSNGNRLRLSATLGNLEGIMASGEPVELPISINAHLGHLNINDIANNIDKRLRRLSPPPSDAVSHDTFRPSDSVALLLPRNLRGDIRVSIDETVYTNLHLHNLRTGIRLAGGVADIDSLDIDSDFGRASLRLRYDSSDIEKMSMEASLGLERLDIVNFFDNFHSLLLMMPQMKNLSGILSARLNGSVSLFPTMFVDVPGIRADLSVKGRHLQVHQTPFIRRITKMMLIHTSDDIHIANMNVRAQVHDNLLELYPFNFSFDRYRLTMNGLNNFNGDLCYHLGVMKSPVPFPFGIRIEGEFHKPRLRFSSAHYHDKDAWRVTENVEGEYSFNLTRELNKFLKAFMHAAVKAANDPSYSL